MDDYDTRVGQVRRTLRQMDGKHPPLRLPLGQMALEHNRAALDAEARELETWAHLSATTDLQHADANQPIDDGRQSNAKRKTRAR
jgi:hypothetical protein